MSAELYGTKQLSDVHAESLASLLCEFRSSLDPYRPCVTGILALDNAINQYRPDGGHHSLHVNDQSRPSPDPDYQIEEHFTSRLDAIETRDVASPARWRHAKLPPTIIHISNSPNATLIPTSCLIYRLIADSVLTVDVGGKQGVAIYIDCSHSFDPTVLYDVALACIEKAADDTNEVEVDGPSEDESLIIADKVIPDSREVEVADELESIIPSHAVHVNEGEAENTTNFGSLNPEDVDLATKSEPQPHDSIAEKALQHVHVLECTDSKSLLEALQDLPSYILDAYAATADSESESDSRQLETVIINDINRFYWNDKHEADSTRLDNTDTIGPPRGSESSASQILNELKNIQRRLECPLVVYTTTQTSNTSGTISARGAANQSQVATEFLLQPAANPIFDTYAHSALLTLHPVRNPVIRMSQKRLEECLTLRDKSLRATANSEYQIFARPGGLSEQKLRVNVNGQVVDDVGLVVKINEDGCVTFEKMDE